MSEELRRKLKAAREKLGFSQPQAAKHWDIPLNTLINWENNRRTPDAFKMKVLTEKLDAILAE